MSNRHINHLENFVKLSCLILDNNRIVADQSCTPVPSLRTLSVNNNEIEELGVFIEHIATIFPNLRHLSMLRNPAVPSPFIEGAYQEYRYVPRSIQPLFTEQCIDRLHLSLSLSLSIAVNSSSLDSRSSSFSIPQL